MILRLQSEQELELLQSRIKAKSTSIKGHMNGLREERGTNAAPPTEGITHADGGAPGKIPGQLVVAAPNPAQDASRKPQKRPRRVPGYISESDILRAILAYLKLHPRVSWVVRINSGALRYENRFIKFGSRGFPDVIGMLKEGRILAVEVKSSRGEATPEQQAFIDKVNEDGGLGCIAKSLDDVRALLT